MRDREREMEDRKSMPETNRKKGGQREMMKQTCSKKCESLAPEVSSEQRIPDQTHNTEGV